MCKRLEDVRVTRSKYYIVIHCLSGTVSLAKLGHEMHSHLLDHLEISPLQLILLTVYVGGGGGACWRKFVLTGFVVVVVCFVMCYVL